MSRSDGLTDSDRTGGTERQRGTERPIEEYVLGVRVLECTATDGDTRYRFEAPDHVGCEFDDLEAAKLYADVYFDVNGFVEEGTGDRGIPPEVVQGGKDTLAVYLLTRPWADVYWVASFYGVRPGDIERYVEWVRTRAKRIREAAVDGGLE